MLFNLNQKRITSVLFSNSSLKNYFLLELLRYYFGSLNIYFGITSILLKFKYYFDFVLGVNFTDPLSMNRMGQMILSEMIQGTDFTATILALSEG
jgi:hypothetical protein